MRATLPTGWTARWCQRESPGPSIRIWDVSYRRGRGRPWYVRWSANDQERGPKTFTTEDEVEDYQAGPRLAMRDGERWNLNTGLPVSWNPLTQLDVVPYRYRGYRGPNSRGVLCGRTVALRWVSRGVAM